jgi:hypothetical protein
MAKVSSKTVRVTEISPSITQPEFLAIAKGLASEPIEAGWFSAATPGHDNPVISLASQFEGQVGTISLPSEKHKTRALISHGSEWRVDDKFNGVTVLYSPANPDLEYNYSYLRVYKMRALMYYTAYVPFMALMGTLSILGWPNLTTRCGFVTYFQPRSHLIRLEY